ncbi:uncharacterized protein [Rutidosis leptorrhynchoides]|uniref:uncharacterized protein n=1 Tax=Rutidosis leptorrhynchoides TaxID=125765 RepID=UPI003A9A32E6
MCSDQSSPRISFSNDLPGIDDSQMQIPRRDTLLLDSNSDFEFIINNNNNSKFDDQYHQQSSSADELFAYGMILPVQGRNSVNTIAQLKRNSSINSAPPPPLPPSPPPTEIEIDEEKAAAAANTNSNKSFWKFKRSSSLKCDAINYKKSIISSFPILSRSHSTGSSQNLKKLSKQPSSLARSSLSSSSSSSSLSNMQKPLLSKNTSFGNGMKISPVLNVPPPAYISKGAANLLGFGFLLRKDKKNKK